MTTRNYRPLVAILLLALALLAVSLIGALRARRAFLTQGIPNELPEPIDHGGVQLGMNVQLGQYGDEALEEALEQIAATGAQAVKQSFYFSQPFDWSESDRMVDAVARSDLELIPLLDGNPALDFAPPLRHIGFRCLGR